MKIAIVGYGLEGESNYRYWSRIPENDITIIDEQQPDLEIPTGVKAIIGPEALGQLDGFDLVVRTAGWSPNKIKTNAKIWSATNEFFSKCPAQIIGVTGTKGKGTICTLIASLLKADDRKVWLVGNIGKPSLSVLDQILPEDIVVYELSSFQLWDIEYSPHIAVVSVVEPEHLDVHIDFNDYLEAKMNIRKHQGVEDICIYHPNNENSRLIAKASDAGRVLRYGIEDDGGVYIKNGDFYQGVQRICSVDELQLIGRHNFENACAAITVARFHGISDDSIRRGLENCKGLPHRLEFVRELDGVRYYNDSFSSSVPATIAAIKSFKQPEVLIIGGIDRGGDFGELRKAILESDNIGTIVLIGEIRYKLAEILSGMVGVNVIATDLIDMKSIVLLAKLEATPGSVVVLTPGCASFDMFKNFYERGDQFKDEVNKL